MPARIRSIAERHLKDPARIAIAREKTAAGTMPRVRQIAYLVARPHKAAGLERVLDTENPPSALVFCRTRLEVDALVETLTAHGHRAEALHGGMEQRQRDRVMARFRQGTAELLVATDVAARGLDVERLSHVINYDVPNSADTYLHRIGRTGRAGREGTAITFVEPREHRLLRSMEAATKQRIEVAPLPTVADLRARRLELTRASLRERLLAGAFDQARVVVESLAGEFDVLDIAAAAVQMAHAAVAGEGDDREIPATGATPAGDRGGDRRPLKPARGKLSSPERSGSDDDGPLIRVFVGAGRRGGVRPGDLVGAITGESGLDARLIGAIEINDAFSLVEIPETRADEVIAALRGTKIRGLKPTIRRER
jgi:ATP-dependent RNA helicase DeaD